MKDHLLGITLLGAVAIACSTGNGNEPGKPPGGSPSTGGVNTSGGSKPSGGSPGAGGGANNPSGGSGGTEPFGNGPCPAQSSVGHFEIENSGENKSVSGSIAERALPVGGQILVLEEGSCRLLRRENPFCDPPCSAGMICVPGGECKQEPKNLNAGTISISGMKKAIKMEPRSSNLYFDTDLPDILYDIPSDIRLTASGKEAPSFSLRSIGVVPLEMPNAKWTIAKNQAFDLTWSATPKQEMTRILVQINIDQHGNSPVTMSCEFEDTGSASIPAPLIDKLLSMGVSGFPTATVTRRAASHVDIAPGCVALHVISGAVNALNVVGHTPCKKTSDCPAGQICDPKTETCK